MEIIALETDRVSPRYGVLSEPSTAPHALIQLLPCAELIVGSRSVHIDLRTQRLLALLALMGGKARRGTVATMLWPEVEEARALSSLRTTLCGLSKINHRVVEIDANSLSLSTGVEVDLIRSKQLAANLINGEPPPRDIILALQSLRQDLLPDWTDDWLILEQQHFHQLRLHALESLCQWLLSQRRYAQAIEAGIEVAGCDPLRESAHRLLIMAHLAEGNRCEAIKQYQTCARILYHELGLRPNEGLDRLLRQAQGLNPATSDLTFG